MKQTENNEVDLLLRGLARREAARPVAPEANSAEHLDADELNSYAEQALPAAARARYTSHLAECARCRKIVSELAASSGANVIAQSVAQSTSAGLRQKLAALFAPGLWRYAVPAVAILAFIGVALVVLNQRTGSEFVARTERPASRQSTEASPTGSPNQPEKFDGASEGQLNDSLAASRKDRDNFAKSEDKNEVPKETSKIETSTDSVTVAENRQDASDGKASGAVAQTQPTYAPEPAAPPPAKPQTTHAEARTEVTARQKEEADQKKDEPAREQEGARARRDDNQNQVARSPVAKLGDTLSRETPTTDSKRRAGEKTSDGEVETRTVSGRRFRRQGSIWIDTSFQSSLATTTVTRGSEQFRALIADEPGLRTIAAQLPGEVVVVWKGRAYRIR